MVGTDRRRPRRPQLGLVATIQSVPQRAVLRNRRDRAACDGQTASVAVLIDEPRWWFRGRRWCHLVSDASLDELHDFAEPASASPGGRSRATTTTSPRSTARTWWRAGAVEVESRELVRRLRAAGLRLTPAQRRAMTAADSPRRPPGRLAEQVAGAPGRARPRRAVDDEPLEELDAGRVGEVAGLQPAVTVVVERAATGADRGHDERAPAAGLGDRVGQALDDVEDGVGVLGAVDDDDGAAAVVVVEDEGDRLAPWPAGAWRAG